jgi:hypothetical protein
MTPYIFRFHFAVGYTTDDSNNTMKVINLQSVTVCRVRPKKVARLSGLEGVVKQAPTVAK